MVAIDQLEIFILGPERTFTHLERQCSLKGCEQGINNL